MLTAMDVASITSEIFAPDAGKLAAEIEANVGDPGALHAIGARIVADYGQEGLRKVMHLINTIHAEEFSNPETFDAVYGKRWSDLRLTKTKGQIASERFSEVYRGSSGKRKKTTKAEAVARHIAGLVKLLQDEPDEIINPILDHLLERIKLRARGSTQ